MKNLVKKVCDHIHKCKPILNFLWATKVSKPQLSPAGLSDQAFLTYTKANKGRSKPISWHASYVFWAQVDR